MCDVVQQGAVVRYGGSLYWQVVPYGATYLFLFLMGTAPSVYAKIVNMSEKIIVPLCKSNACM